MYYTISTLDRWLAPTELRPFLANMRNRLAWNSCQPTKLANSFFSLSRHFKVFEKVARFWSSMLSIKCLGPAQIQPIIIGRNNYFSHHQNLRRSDNAWERRAPNFCNCCRHPLRKSSTVWSSVWQRQTPRFWWVWITLTLEGTFVWQRYGLRHTVFAEWKNCFGV